MESLKRKAILRHILIYILILIVGGMLALLVWPISGDEAEEDTPDMPLNEFDQMINELREEKAAIQEELSQIALQVNQGELARGIVSILLEQPDMRLYTGVVPFLRQYGYHGVIAVSEEYFPGDIKEDTGLPSCLTVEQFRELLEDGWTYCLTVTKDSNLSRLNRRITQIDLPMAETAYFPEGEYTQEQLETLQEWGVKNLICAGKAEGTLQPDGMLRLGAVKNWEWSAANDEKLRGWLSEGKTVYFAEGYNATGAEFSQGKLSDMISCFRQYESEGIGTVATTAGARLFYEKSVTMEDEELEELKRRRAELEERLEEITQKINSMFK